LLAFLRSSTFSVGITHDALAPVRTHPSRRSSGLSSRRDEADHPGPIGPDGGRGGYGIGGSVGGGAGSGSGSGSSTQTDDTAAATGDSEVGLSLISIRSSKNSLQNALLVRIVVHSFRRMGSTRPVSTDRPVYEFTQTLRFAEGAVVSTAKRWFAYDALRRTLGVMPRRSKHFTST
jgi:hypothetical protein